MSELKRWREGVTVPVDLVFTGSGETMTAEELAMWFHQHIIKHSIRWEITDPDDRRKISGTLQLIRALPQAPAVRDQLL